MFANENKYSLLPAAFGGTINLELWKADKAFCLLVLRRVIKKYYRKSRVVQMNIFNENVFTSSFMYQ